jgi:lipopolysaccharide heptosyltransferase II
MIPRVAGIIRKEKIEVIHAHSRVPAWIAYFAARRTNAIFITTCHGYYSKHIFSQVMGWAKRVIVISNVIGRHMIDNFSVPHERIRLIPSSVDLEKFQKIISGRKKMDEFHIGMVGRITPLKGHLHFIKAMAKVVRTIPRIKIWIVGDAPVSKEAYKEEIQVLVKRLGLWHCTEFLGNQKDIPAIMSQLDVLVLANTTPEAFGRVIVEAQACMVPVVATRVGGVVDIIEDTKTGLLVPPADPSSMADAVIRILKDNELTHRLTENAFKKVQEQYSAELMVKRTLDVYKEASENFKVLIIKFSSLGDIILSTAAIKAIRNRFPRNYRISFLVGRDSRDLLLACPYIDELLVYDFKDKDRGIKGLLKLGSVLRKNNFDIVIDLQNNRKSHILSGLTFGLNRYGFDNKKFAFLLNHRVKGYDLPMPAVPHQFQILKMLGIELEDSCLEIWPQEKDQDYVKELLSAEWISAKQKIIGINISASPRWATKNWSLSHLIEFCKEAGLRDMRIVITGTEKDLALGNELIAAVKDAKIINACGKTTVNQLACLIKRCSLYICLDSASLHIAAAMSVPFIALFGPTDPSRHFPPAKDYILLKKDLPCSPCYKSKCKTRSCMDLITPQEVFEAADKLLK